MKVGDLVKFKDTGAVGTIIALTPVAGIKRFKLLHNAKGIRNPAFFNIDALMQLTEVISESR